MEDIYRISTDDAWHSVFLHMEFGRYHECWNLTREEMAHVHREPLRVTIPNASSNEIKVVIVSLGVPTSSIVL